MFFHVGTSRLFPIFISVFILSACGGGGKESTPYVPIPISGVAVTGAPIIGTVKIKDSNGIERKVDINSDGSYSIDTRDMMAPFILMAEGTVSGRAYSVTAPATSSDTNGTVNITPLSDIVLGYVMGENGQAAYQSGSFINITDTNITAQEDILKQQSLAGILTDVGFDTFDISQSIIHTPFSADHTGIDLALDMIDVDVDKGTNVITISLVDGSSSVFGDFDTGPTDIPSLSGTGVSAPSIDEYKAILAVIEGFVADLNDGADVGTLASTYFTATFLDNGIDSAAFLSKLGAGVSINNIAINSLDLTVGAEVAVIRFMISSGSVLYGPAEMQFVNDGTGWLFDGNRKLASISLRPYVEKESTYKKGDNNPEATVYYSGLNLVMDINDASEASPVIDNGITQATLTGPGLASPVVLTPHINLNVRFVNGASWNGFIPLNDADIGEINEGSMYNLVIDYNDGLPKQVTYQIRLNKPPVTNIQAISQPFSTIISPASATLLDAIDSSLISLLVTWSLEEDMVPFEIDSRSDCTGTSYGSTKRILITDSLADMTGTDYGSTCEGILRFTALDKFSSEVVTTYKITNL